MLTNIILKLQEWYHKANINTVIGGNVEKEARMAECIQKIMGPSRICPGVTAMHEVERRKEKYGRRILKVYRKQGREELGIIYLKNHFVLYLDNIVNGEPIPEYPAGMAEETPVTSNP